jgi:hypothetical protein
MLPVVLNLAATSFGLLCWQSYGLVHGHLDQIGSGCVFLQNLSLCGFKEARREASL